MNLFRLHNHLVLTLDDGSQFTTTECTDEFAAQVAANLHDKEALVNLFNPKYAAAKSFLDRAMQSKILSVEGASVYIRSISQLTIPQDFAEKILDAFEKELGIMPGETDKDGLFSLTSLRCVGACGLAPVALVDGKVFGRLAPANVKNIVQEYRDMEK